MKDLGVLLTVLGASLLLHELSSFSDPLPEPIPDPSPIVDPSPPPSPSPVSDCLSQSYEVDRKERINLLRRMADLTPPESAKDDLARAEWHRVESVKIFNEAFKPYTKQVAKAIMQGPDSIRELADKLEKGSNP